MIDSLDFFLFVYSIGPTYRKILKIPDEAIPKLEFFHSIVGLLSHESAINDIDSLLSFTVLCPVDYVSEFDEIGHHCHMVVHQKDLVTLWLVSGEVFCGKSGDMNTII